VNYLENWMSKEDCEVSWVPKVCLEIKLIAQFPCNMNQSEQARLAQRFQMSGAEQMAADVIV